MATDSFLTCPMKAKKEPVITGVAQKITLGSGFCFFRIGT